MNKTLDEMKIITRLTCPKCDHTYEVRAFAYKRIGDNIQCSKCNTVAQKEEWDINDVILLS